MLARDKEVERGNGVGRTREADAQMKGYVQAFQSVLQKTLPPVPLHNAPSKPALLLHEAACFQRAQAKEMRGEVDASQKHERATRRGGGTEQNINKIWYS